MASGRWNFGDGVFGERRPEPAVPRIRFGENQIATGWHEHGDKKHTHEEGNEVHRHGNNDEDLGVDSDKTLISNPTWS
jgi:hypothetical protein